MEIQKDLQSCRSGIGPAAYTAFRSNLNAQGRNSDIMICVQDIGIKGVGDPPEEDLSLQISSLKNSDMT